MKKAFLLSAVLFIGFSLFAYDKGDISVNFELPLGLDLPGIVPERPADVKDVNDLSVGFEWGLRGTVNYHFTNMFSVNLGIGLGSFWDWYVGTGKTPDSTMFSDVYLDYAFSTQYFIIPFGARFNARAFVLGLGLNCYIPFGSEYTGTIQYDWLDDKIKIKDDGFAYKPWLGGYFDIGFDLGGRDDQHSGFGMVFRTGVGFPKNIVESDRDYDVFRHTTLSLVFNFNFGLANVLGGKK